MFNEKEIKEALQEEARGTNDHQPLQFVMRNGPPQFQAKNQRNERNTQ